MPVSIIGAGVAGLCIATELRNRNIEVALYERAAGLGADACSWWAGGMLAPWCEQESAPDAVVRFGAIAADWWQQQGAEVSRNGSLVLALARDRAELKRFARRTGGYREIGEAEIAALEPDLAGRFSRALFFAGESHLTPRKATATLLAKLQRDPGADVHFSTAMEPRPQRGTIIDCRGFAARDVLNDLRGVKGEMLVLQCTDVTLSRPVRLLHPRIPLYLVPRGDGHFMVGATMIESDERTRISARSMLELLGAAYALHPAFGEAQVAEIGVDVRPAFADNLPRLRRLDGILYANGLYRHGFLLAPALAQMTASVIDNSNSVPEWLDEDHP